MKFMKARFMGLESEFEATVETATLGLPPDIIVVNDVVFSLMGVMPDFTLCRYRAVSMEDTKFYDFSSMPAVQREVTKRRLALRLPPPYER